MGDGTHARQGPRPNGSWMTLRFPYIRDRLGPLGNHFVPSTLHHEEKPPEAASTTLSGFDSASKTIHIYIYNRFIKIFGMRIDIYIYIRCIC